MSSLEKLAIGASLVLLCVGAVRADTIWLGESTTGAIKVENVKVQEPRGDSLQYITDQGVQTGRPFSNLQRINIDGETTFNAAEDAFARVNASGKADPDYDTAITEYQSVLQSSSKSWMQTRAALRLIAAAKAKNRYDAEVSAYVTLVQKDPATATANRPAPPPEHSPYLDAALASVARCLDDSNLNDTQKSTLLNLQLQINQAKGDSTAVQGTLKQLVALGGGTDAMKATLKLADANVAYQSKQFSQAIADIEQNKALFTDPDQQIEALFVLAQSKFAVDGEKTDADVQKDLALNYMRVVTFGGQLPDKPHVAESLDRAAEIEIKLKDQAAAVQLYQQLLRDKAHASPELIAKAQTALGQLGKGQSQ